MVINILFISPCVGLGHILKDLAIIHELKKINEDVSIDWLASKPGLFVLKELGENILPESEDIPSETELFINKRVEYNFPLHEWFAQIREPWAKSVEIFFKVIAKKKYDLIIGDDAFGIARFIADSYNKGKPAIDIPFVNILAMFGLDPIWIYDEKYIDSPYKEQIHQICTLAIKGALESYGTDIPDKIMSILYVGEKESLPNNDFYGTNINRHKYAEKQNFHFTGFILPFSREELQDQDILKERLGFKDKKLIICLAGGTSIGKPVLQLCIDSFDLIKREVSNAHMVIIGGHYLNEKDFNISNDITILSYVPKSFEYMVASDMAITQGGATTVSELASLNKPFIYFPLEEQVEQSQVMIFFREKGIGINLSFSETTREILANKVIENISKPTNYPEINYDGAKNTANIISGLLDPSQTK